MRRRPIVAAAGAALLTAVLAACGTTEPTAGAAEGSEAASAAATIAPSTEPSGSCSDDSTTTSTAPVSLTDSFGRTVDLERPAAKVAVLEWQQTEDVLTLCLTPVAVADVAGYTTWNTAEALPAGVVDVGTRGEPSLDALFATEPDLVIVEAYTPDDEIIGQLAAYGVPVLATKGADTADPVQTMLDTFTLIAKATGREERAGVVVDEFRASMAEAKQAVTDSGTDIKDFVYFDGWIQGGNVAIRPFGQGSLMGEIGEQLGMTNAWTGEVDAAYGLGQTDIEGMSDVGTASFFHTGTVDQDGDVLAELQKNDIWRALPAVAEGRVYAFPAGIWTFGGPRSAEQVIDAYVGHLTG